MKTKTSTGVAVLAGIVLFAIASPAQVRYTATGDDGITASPKVRAQLNEHATRSATVATTAPEMACPKCKNESIARPVRNAKGAQFLAAGGVPTEKITRHLCPSCETTITVAGTGKAKHDVAVHKCVSCGAEYLACCSTTGHGGITKTKGMENKIDIAPLK